MVLNISEGTRENPPNMPIDMLSARPTNVRRVIIPRTEQIEVCMVEELRRSKRSARHLALTMA